MLRNHCDTLHASDFLGEIPNPCDGGISKRTWESQVMLCRQKLREFKQGHDVQGGSSDDKQGGASSDDDDEGGEPAEPRFVIDDEGQITFQDIIKDSLEEEVHAFMEEIEHNNIRKMHGAYCCPFCPFRAFGRLCQLSDHLRRHHVAAKQFVCSGKKQLKVILALHDSDSVRKENGADYLFRSAMSLELKWFLLSAARERRSKICQPKGPWRTNRCPQSVEHLLRQILCRNGLQGNCLAPFECSLAAAEHARAMSSF